MKLVLCILLSLAAVARPQHYGGLTDYQDEPVRQQLDEKKFGMPFKTFFCDPAFSNSGKTSKKEVSLFPSAIPATLNILIQSKIRYVLKKSIAEKTNYGKIKKSY